MKSSELRRRLKFRRILEVLTRVLLFLLMKPAAECVCVCVLLTDADSMRGVEDEPQPTHTAIAPPGVHTDAVLTQPRLEALIHVYAHQHTRMSDA